MVSQKPIYPSDKSQAGSLKSPKDWEIDFALLKGHFPDISAITMYSTTDGNVTHLMNAMPAAKRHGLMLLVGVWSSPATRFQAEMETLQAVIYKYGCRNIAAVSVGNEDLNSANVNNPTIMDQEEDAQKKCSIATTLSGQMSHISAMTRSLGCCVPVTHTDTWNKFSNMSKPWIRGVYPMRNC